MIKYHRKSYNSCCLSCLSPAFHSISDNRAVTDLVNHIEESLTLHKDKFRNIIHFSNAIMTIRMKIKGEHNLRYNMVVLHKNNAFIY